MRKPNICRLTVRDVARRIHHPITEWPGNCFGIAEAILKHRMVKGFLRYGIYSGPISDESRHFGGRGVTHHAWIELPSKNIIDPTLWVFEAAEPYIAFVSGDDVNHYDLGGSRLRMAMRSIRGDSNGPPDKMIALKNDGTVGENTLRNLSPEASVYVERIFGHGTLTDAQVNWLAHRAPSELGDAGKSIFQAIIDVGYEALIPMDSRAYYFGYK